MKSSAKNIQIASYDDLFKTDEERSADTQERIQELPLDKLLPFPNHPFKIVDDEKMQDTVDSVKEYGVLVPILVRPKDDGNYEIISGHRRHHASILAGKTEIPAIGENYTDAAIEARILSQQSWIKKRLPEPPKHYHCKGNFKQDGKITGFRALYFHYVYLLRGSAKGTGRRKVSRFLLEDTLKFDRYLTQHKFLLQNKIDTTNELMTIKATLQKQLDKAVAVRKALYDERRFSIGEQKIDMLAQQISSHTSQIKSLRHDLRLCKQIEADSQRIQNCIHEVQKLAEKEELSKDVERSSRNNNRKKK